MKYNININQLALAESKLDLIDSAIMDYCYFLCSSLNEKIVKQRVDGFTWIDYSELIKQMPLLRIKSRGAITPRLRKIEIEGYIEIKRIDNQKIFIKLTSKIDELFTKLNGAVHETKQLKKIKKAEPSQKGQKAVHENEPIIIYNYTNIIDGKNFEKALVVLEIESITENQNSTIVKLMEKYPSRDYEFQAMKCKEWWFTHPRKGWKKPLLAFSNWLERSKPDDAIVKIKTDIRQREEMDERNRFTGPVDPEQKKKVEDLKAQIREKFRMKK